MNEVIKKIHLVLLFLQIFEGFLTVTLICLLDNVDHHVMHTENHQPSTKKEYCSINFAVLDPKF